MGMIVICFVFALKTGLSRREGKKRLLDLLVGPSKSKKLFKGKVPKSFWHSGHLG